MELLIHNVCKCKGYGPICGEHSEYSKYRACDLSPCADTTAPAYHGKLRDLHRGNNCAEADYKHKYKIIYSSIYYYIGLTENAISYLKYLNLENNNISICHKRVGVSNNLIDFYNPLNLIIDYKVRDLAEYFKSCFFNKKMDVLQIVNCLKRIRMSNIDYIYFYIRMLFPSYYFDLYDDVLSGKIKEESILLITNMQDDYEYLLYEIYLVIKSHINIVGIEWINKKFAF